MGRGRAKNGQYEEEDNSVRARLGRLHELGETMRAGEERAEAELAEMERAVRDPLLESPAVRRTGRRAATTLTLELSAIDALDRLALIRHEKRGYILDDLILAAARAELRTRKDGGE